MDTVRNKLTLRVVRWYQVSEWDRTTRERLWGRWAEQDIERW